MFVTVTPLSLSFPHRRGKVMLLGDGNFGFRCGGAKFDIFLRRRSEGLNSQDHPREGLENQFSGAAESLSHRWLLLYRALRVDEHSLGARHHPGLRVLIHFGDFVDDRLRSQFIHSRFPLEFLVAPELAAIEPNPVAAPAASEL